MAPSGISTPLCRFCFGFHSSKCKRTITAVPCVSRCLTPPQSFPSRTASSMTLWRQHCIALRMQVHEGRPLQRLGAALRVQRATLPQHEPARGGSRQRERIFPMWENSNQQLALAFLIARLEAEARAALALSSSTPMCCRACIPAGQMHTRLLQTTCTISSTGFQMMYGMHQIWARCRRALRCACRGGR